MDTEEVSVDEDVVKEEKEETMEAKPAEDTGEKKPSADNDLAELRDRYLRLYAEFENYKKRVQKDKEELVKYGNEALLYEMLPVIDNLEMALRHSGNSVNEGLVKGVEITLREFQRVTEKFGLTAIPAVGRPFDPSVHHAMCQVDRSDLEDKTVVEEFRKGYLLADKVLRPSLVSVSKRVSVGAETEASVQNSKKSEEE